jgi:hypothetical protein
MVHNNPMEEIPKEGAKSQEATSTSIPNAFQDVKI